MRKYISTSIFALLLALSFNYQPLWFLSFFALLPLFAVERLGIFFLYGLVFYLAMYFPLLKANYLITQSWFLSIVLLMVFVLSLTLLQFGVSYIFNRFIRFLPLSFVLVEILRLYVPFDGYPFDYLGSLAANIPTLGLSLHYITVFGWSFVILTINWLVYKILKENERKKYLLGLAFLLLFLGILGLIRLESYKYQPSHLKVAVIQPFIPQKDKLKNSLYTLPYLVYLVNQVPKDVDLILLPETTFEEIDKYDQFFKAFKDRNFIVGVSHIIFDFDRLQLYAQNQALLVVHGKVKQVYVKRFLVPFGEYTPSYFGWLGKLIPYLDNIDYRAGDRDVIFNFRNIFFLPRICFEIAYPQRISPLVDYIVNLTNDAWFYGSWIIKRHLLQAKVRAIETGRPVIFVNNNGFSGILTPLGQYIGNPNRKILIFQL